MKKLALIPILFTIFMWFVNLVQFFTGLDLGTLGIYPREKETLIGIFTSPLIHGNWEHLMSNTLPVLILSVILFVSYQRIAVRIWVFNYLLTGILVWLFARGGTFHIGASGIVYGLASFLFFSGFFRMDVKAIAIASGVAIFYGGMIWGILPIQPGVSWESHLFGGIVGLALAFLYRNKYKTTIVEQHENEINTRKSFDEFINR